MYVINNTTPEELQALQTPIRTATHQPVAHSDAVDLVHQGLQSFGLNVTGEKHQLTHEGNRLFSIFNLKNGGEDYNFQVGMRNTHDKSAAFGLSLGTKVIVCSNMQFGGTVCNKRKHTSGILNELAWLVDRSIGQFVGEFQKKDSFIANMKRAEIVDSQAHDIVVRAMDRKVLPASHVPYALEEWRTPRHPEFQDRNAWSLYNAFTEVHKRVENRALLPEKGLALDNLFQAVVGVDTPVTIEI